MRSMDEQLRLIRGRAEKLRQRRRTLLRSGAAAACLLLAAALGLFLPRPEGDLRLPEGAAYGSLVLSSPLLSYMIIAVLAFALGVVVALLCISRRAAHGAPKDEDK